MSNYETVILSRIGTCRSGRKIDIPCELKPKDISEIIRSFSVDEIVDLFCMTEAFFSRYRDSLDKQSNLKVLIGINRYLRDEPIKAQMAKEFKSLNLITSPDFVRHGQKLLLV